MAVNSTMQMRSILVNQIQALLPTIGLTDDKFQKPNSPFTIPKGKTWLRLTTNDTDSVNQEATGGIRTVSGIMTIDVFSPLNKGDSVAQSAVEVIRAGLSNRYYSDTLRIRQGFISDTTESDWYKVQVQFIYTYEGLTNGG